MTDRLPPGWVRVPLGKVCVTVSKRGPSNDRETFRYVDLGAIDNATKQIRDPSHVRVSEAPSRAKQVLRAGDVLFSNVRVYLENIAQVPNELDGEIASTAFCVLRPAPGIDSRYMYHFVSSRRFVLAVNALQRGNSPPSVQDRDILNQELPLAPEQEQVRIGSRVDELFSEIGEGERALERVQKLVERYRQSVLKAAVTGELTREWREKRRKSLESGDAVLRRIREARGERGQVARDVVTDFLGPLPSNWTRVRVDEAGEVQLGRQRAPSHHQGANMRPYLRVANVFEERIDISDVMSMNFTPKEYVRYALRENDILLNEGQSKELVGRPAMYKGELPGSCFTNTLVRFRAIAAVLPEFALIVFLHYMKSGQFQRIAKITTNIAHLGAERFAQMAFPVPPLEEQGEIVSQVRNQSDAYARLTDGLAVQERQAHALRQSVLKAAFSGTLVAQKTAEEAASSLLERIARDFKTSAVSPRAGRKRRAV